MDIYKITKKITPLTKKFILNSLTDDLGDENEAKEILKILYDPRKRMEVCLTNYFDDEDKNETPKKKSDSFLVKAYRDLKNSGKETKKVKTPSQTNSFLVKGYRDLKKSFKVDEDIKRIKKLL